VAGDNFAEAYVTEVAGHNEGLLSFNAKLKECITTKKSRRLSYSIKESDDVGSTNPKKAFVMVCHKLKQTLPGGCHFFHQV